MIFEAIDDILKQASDFNEYSKALVTLASAVGVIVILYFTIKLAYDLIQVTRLYVCSQVGCCQIDWSKKYGKWAVITGATDGIGQSMARELARRGMSILVVSRNEEKLAKTKAELEQIPNVGEVEVARIDLSDSSLQNFERIRQQIDPDNRDIGVLINNAGTFPSDYKRFNSHDMEFLLNIANLNMIAPLHMTRMIMPGMLKRGKGAVINVSSILGSLVTPYMSIYPSSKTFMDAFTQALQVEYASHPIDIYLLTPGAVHTKLFTGVAKIPKPTLVNPSPEDYAKSAINAISTGIKQYSGTLWHGITGCATNSVQWLGLWPAAFRLNMMISAKNVQLSPVMKRKRVHLVEASPSGDVADKNTAQDPITDKSD